MMERILSITDDNLWMKASVVGGLWASLEIIIGSFLHNLRVPFAGSILAAQGTILVIAFFQVWPHRGLIWRAGLICALMKSVSPSAVILGPMIGIFLEALLIELVIFIAGRNLFAYMLAGALSVTSALLHKLVSLLILYGFNVVEIYVNIYQFAVKQFSVQNSDPWVLVFVLIGIYFSIGIASSLIGYRIGNRSGFAVIGNNGKAVKSQHIISGNQVQPGQAFSLLLLWVHVLMIPLGLIIISRYGLMYSSIFTAFYLAIVASRYKSPLRRLRKPSLWIQLMFLTLLAAIFWEGFENKSSLISLEGLYIGLEMNIRAIFIVVAFSALSTELRNPRIKDFLSEKKMSKLYSSLNHSFEILPLMIEAMPGPGYFFIHPVRSFSYMIGRAREWIESK